MEKGQEAKLMHLSNNLNINKASIVKLWISVNYEFCKIYSISFKHIYKNTFYYKETSWENV